MSRRWQARYLDRPWTDVIRDGCTCRWINYTDDGGWFLIADDPDCPAHHGRTNDNPTT
jgi:hypothetical protein